MRRTSLPLTAVLLTAWLGWTGTAAAHPDLELPHDGLAWCVAYSPDGKTIATGSADAVIRLWDAQTGKPIGTIDALPGPAGRTRATCRLAFTPDGKTLLASVQFCTGKVDRWENTDDIAGGVRVFDLESKKLRYSIEAAKPPLMALAPDGNTFATGRCAENNCEVALWEVATGKQIGILPYRKEMPTDLAFSPDGKRLAVGTENGTVELWDPAAKKILTRMALT